MCSIWAEIRQFMGNIMNCHFLQWGVESSDWKNKEYGDEKGKWILLFSLETIISNHAVELGPRSISYAWKPDASRATCNE